MWCSFHPHSGASGRNPTQTMLSNKMNLLLRVTEKSKVYVSGTAGSRGSSDAIGVFVTHSLNVDFILR